MHAKIVTAVLTVACLGGPAAGAQSELHTFHCLHGCPVGAPATNDTIVREIYTLSSDDITKLADWVAYRVTPASIGPSDARERQPDPWLGSNETLAPRDYDGASAALHIDRGHQAPLASFSGTSFASDTNFLSNITPQASALNQCPWVRIEDQETALAKRLNTAVYVLTGPLYERLMKPLPNVQTVHRVPSGYWKVVALSDGRMSGFIFDQSTERRKEYCGARVGLREIVLRSRLVLFPDNDAAATGGLDHEIGCDAPSPEPTAPSEIPEPRARQP